MSATVADASAAASADSTHLPGPGFPNFVRDDIYGGGHGQYIPFTPLGALSAVKGDLVMPIVGVGVAVFILLIVILAVKAALMWKAQVTEDIVDRVHGGPRRFQREIHSNANAAPPEDDMLNNLSEVVLSAISSKCWSQRILCEVGSFARQRDDLSRLIKVVDLITPEAYKSSLNELRESADSDFDCRQRFTCSTNLS